MIPYMCIPVYIFIFCIYIYEITSNMFRDANMYTKKKGSDKPKILRRE